MLIDTEIGEMNKPLGNILNFRCILISCKSGEPFFEHIDSQWVIAGHEHINSKIIFEIVDQMRVSNIL